ncbi:GTPase-activating protein and VPS9 domain-containing protein 1-like isoform X2 [Tubulanus polymorphus]|uniref:GTPase-activating protein and VPS9 domain-containing protein 1-like isoform X2 n=1 Tax=Tubulanus polymorphus TaxID=672921 RepID=UPI003DA4D3AC
MNSGSEEILELIRHLKQERLFVTSEKYQLQKLNESVHKTAETLCHLAWIAREQRINLESLLRGNPDSSQHASFHKANALEVVKFVDAYRHLSYHESKFSEFFKSLRASPKLLAACLIRDKQQSGVATQNIVGIIISAVYANCTLQEDEQYVLQITRALMEAQLLGSDDPARVLRRGTCAFSVIYKQLIEGSYAARLFLTAALNAPVMFLLKDFEWFYDVDAEKALQRFSTLERKRRFGANGTDAYRVKTGEYRDFIVNKLVQLTECFIASIKKTMYCFPASLSWIVSQMNYILTKDGKVSAAKAREMCIDLIFTKFICPAICDPAAVGITSDVPISYIARHNLMQVATILQVLAISQQHEMDSRAKDVYGRFDRHCLSSLFDPMLEIPSSALPPQPNCQLPGVDRSAVLITPTELNDLITFLQGIQLNLPVDDEDRKSLDEMLNNLPKNVIQTTSTPSSTPSGTPPGTPSFPAKKSMKGKKKSSILTVEDVVVDETIEPDLFQPEDVLVISINQSGDCLGMMSEDKVVQQEQEVHQRKIKQNFYPGYDDGEDVNEEEVQEKRTRFSLSHDQDSIGNTSDNIEAISEACSSHSVESTDSVNGENDNLSDMFSANVSGRETPNISGRDTPLSQAESEEVLAEQETRRVPDLPVTVHKSNREDVTERFQKFDIKTELERQGRNSSLYLPDEIKSTVSDTWSTDVLASDSEPPDSNQLDRLEEVAEEIVTNGNLMEDQEVPVFNLLLSNSSVPDVGPPVRGSSLHVSEMSETASECWSTDVLASDTDEKQSERLLELDQDDSISISSKSQGIEDNMSEYSETGPDVQNLDDIVAPEIPNRTSTKLKLSPRPPHRPDNFLAFGDSENPPRELTNEIPDSRIDDVFDSDSSASILDRVGEKAKYRRSSHDRRLVIPDLDVASPDLGVESMDTTPDAGAASQHLVLGLRERDSGISETPIDESKDAGGVIGAVADLHNSFKSLKLTEQQNTKIDANRLSAAISMFDPILQESDDEVKEDVAMATGAAKSGSLLVQLDDTDEKEKLLLGSSLGSDNDVTKSRTNTGSSIGSLSIELPKAITFGFLVPERDDKADRNRKSNFFKTFKEKFHKGAKRKSKSDKGEPMDEKGMDPSSCINGSAGDMNNEETSDDILAKYSKKMTTDPRFTSHLSKDRPVRCDDDDNDDEEDDLPAYDPNNVENCRAFRNAKKKLRMVFSTADFQTLPCSSSTAMTPRRNSLLGVDGDHRRDNEVVALLRMQQAEAINLQDKELVAQLQETIRCIRIFDHDGIKKLLRNLKEDYKTRSYYISYLVKCRQNLLATQSHLERLIDRVRRDKEICHKHFISTCVHRFLQKRENSVIRFMDEFHKLTMPDEKTDLVEQFLDELYNAIMSDSQWQTANETQIDDSQLAIERMIMNRIYSMAMFPNGDGDITRDKILHEHIKKLSAMMTPSHPYLRIPKVYHSEAPWVSAQEEIKLINAYKTPKDKVQCVLNTSCTIMNLLSMACEKSVPAADDFTPILIYVVIKANPPHLLSNVQYVNSFYQKRIGGEEQYWWMQFSSAIEFIKTMEYNV